MTHVKGLIFLLLLTPQLVGASTKGKTATERLCFGDDGVRKDLTQDVNKNLSKEYYNDFRHAYPSMSGILAFDFQDPFKFAHLYCRAKNCVRASAVEFAKLNDKRGQTEYNVTSVTCSEKSKGGFTTELNWAFENLRTRKNTVGVSYLPEVQIPKTPQRASFFRRVLGGVVPDFETLHQKKEASGAVEGE